MRAVAVSLALVLLSACGAPPTTTTKTPSPPLSSALPQAVKHSGEIFNSQWTVTIIARDPTALLQARTQQHWIKAALVEVERQLSSWPVAGRPSELSRFNAAAWTKAVPVTPGLGAVLSTCIDVGQRTDGAFDITLGPLLDVWGFSAASKGTVTAPPTAEQIAVARARTGLGLLHVGSGGLQKDREDLVVDVTAVGDGAGAAAVMKALQERGFRDVLVDVAGEVVASGQGLDKPWQVGVNVPSSAAAPDDIERVVALETGTSSAGHPHPGTRALSTSGTYREALVVGSASEGKRYPHILDPRTGAPVTHDLVSCTVIANDVVVADALSTACVALGEEGTRAILDRFPDAEVLFIHQKPDLSFASSTTKGFPASR
ncbi:MAG: FAD:protein FMN transferase [Deltaproteobacteria bacterium]|nr:FAD:protein FMN transferase [Deltaproteobacteria bacterium]